MLKSPIFRGQGGLALQLQAGAREALQEGLGAPRRLPGGPLAGALAVHIFWQQRLFFSFTHASSFPPPGDGVVGPLSLPPPRPDPGHVR